MRRYSWEGFVVNVVVGAIGAAMVALAHGPTWAVFGVGYLGSLVSRAIEAASR